MACLKFKLDEATYSRKHRLSKMNTQYQRIQRRSSFWPEDSDDTWRLPHHRNHATAISLPHFDPHGHGSGDFLDVGNNADHAAFFTAQLLQRFRHKLYAFTIKCPEAFVKNETFGRCACGFPGGEFTEAL